MRRASWGGLVMIPDLLATTSPLAWTLSAKPAIVSTKPWRTMSCAPSALKLTSSTHWRAKYPREVGL
eukprot:10116032-Lingulodinium_polyedra.AAC.1